MSTDGRLYRRRSRAFRRTVTVTLGVLAVAAAGLGVAGVLRGPALDEASVDASAAVQRPEQRLVLRADQMIDAVTADDVRIDPATPFEVSSEGGAITVRFTGMLRALTEYDIAVDVTGSATGVAGRLEFAFTTPDLSLAVLVDAESGTDSGQDEVRRVEATSGAAETLFAGDDIAEFAELSYGVAAVLADRNGIPARVVIAPTGESVVQEIALPGPGRVQKLRSARASDLLGFVYTSAEAGTPGAAMSQLLLFDPVDMSGTTRPVIGLDGEPVSVLDWTFVPGTPYLVAQTFDELLLLVDTATDTPPIPLGEHTELRGFVPGTVRLVVANVLSGSTIDLAAGTTTELDLPADGRPDGDYRGQLVVIDDDSYVEVVSRPADDVGFVLDYEVILVSGSSTSVVADPEPGEFVRGLCLSPNAQFAAIETLASNGDPGSGRISVVDLATGETRLLPGRAVSWCA